MGADSQLGCMKPAQPPAFALEIGVQASAWGRTRRTKDAAV